MKKKPHNRSKLSNSQFVRSGQGGNNRDGGGTAAEERKLSEDDDYELSGE